MTVLVVGSVALDSVETPFGKADNVLGGSATFFSASASHLAPVQLVGVVGNDYPVDELEPLAARGVDLAGLEQRRGRVVPLARPLPPRPQRRRDARDAPRRVLALPAEDSRAVPQRAVRLPRQHRSAAAARRAARRSSKPKLVACDTMNFWIESRRPDLLELLEHVDLITLNDGEARQLTEEFNLVKAARWIMERGPKHVDHQEGRARRVHVHARRRSSSRRRIRSRRCSIRPARATRSPAASWAISRARGDLSDANLRRAVVYGSAMGSFAVEKFSVERLLEITRGRHRGARAPSSTSSSRSSRSCRDRRAAAARLRAAPASTSTPPTTRSSASRRSVESTFTAGARGEFGGFGGMFRVPDGVRAARARRRAPTASAPRSRSRSRRTATTRSATIS